MIFKSYGHSVSYFLVLLYLINTENLERQDVCVELEKFIDTENEKLERQDVCVELEKFIDTENLERQDACVDLKK